MDTAMTNGGRYNRKIRGVSGYLSVGVWVTVCGVFGYTERGGLISYEEDTKYDTGGDGVYGSSSSMGIVSYPWAMGLDANEAT